MESAPDDRNSERSQLIVQLSSSIEGVYSAFALYPLREVVHGCPHCIGEEDQRHVHRAPLRELTPEDLGRYAASAMTTWGDSVDYRHFLPRIIELSVSENSASHGLDPWLIGSKLSYAGWEQWPSRENEALMRFMEAAWHVVLAHPPDDAYLLSETRGPVWWPVDEALALPANAGIDISRFLNLWHPSNGPNPSLHLALFATSQAATFWKKKSIDMPTFVNQTALKQLEDWLLRPALRNSLEDVFARELDGERSDLLARGVDALEWMRLVEKKGTL